MNPVKELRKLTCTEYPKATLDTLKSDCYLNHWMKSLLDKGLLSMADIEAYMPLEEVETPKTDKPLVTLTGSPTCGAHARRSGKPCLAPAMRGKKRCRLHGGKSTGRPVVTGLKGKAFMARRKAIKQVVSKMMQNKANENQE